MIPIVNSLFAFNLFTPLAEKYALDDPIARILKALPEWEASNASIHKISKGVTNANYKADVKSNSYFVKCGFKENSHLGASLENEWTCVSMASMAGLAPKPVFHDADEGIFITNFVDTGDRSVNLRDPLSEQKFCSLIRALHTSNLQFSNHFSPFDCISNYLDKAKEFHVPLPGSFFSIVLPWLKKTQETSPPLSSSAPCHFDLHSGNILDDGNRYWLIDWEYAAMGDPLFDLATAASIEELTDEEMLQMLQTYFDGRCPSQKEISHFRTMRILADLRWSLWCYLQSEISSLDLDFSPYGDRYLQNALARLPSGHLTQ